MATGRRRCLLLDRLPRSDDAAPSDRPATTDRAAGPRSDDAVGSQALRFLELAHGRLGPGSEDAVDLADVEAAIHERLLHV